MKVSFLQISGHSQTASKKRQVENVDEDDTNAGVHAEYL